MNEIPDLISRPGSFKGGAYLRGPQQLWHMAGREIVRLWVPAEQMMTVRGSGKPKRYMAVSTQGYCTQFTSRRIAEPVSLGFIVVDVPTSAQSTAPCCSKPLGGTRNVRDPQLQLSFSTTSSKLEFVPHSTLPVAFPENNFPQPLGFHIISGKSIAFYVLLPT